MAYDNWIHVQVLEQIQELVRKNLAAYPALAEPVEFTKTKRFEGGYVVSLVHVVGNVHETKKAWRMSFIVRNLTVEPLMGFQGSNFPIEENLQIAKSNVPEVSLLDWALWNKNRKVLWSGNFVNRPRQATA